MHSKSINFSAHNFAKVIELPAQYDVYDFTREIDMEMMRNSVYGVGRYDEKRVNMYTTPLFAGMRSVHMGIDIAAPVGTKVFAFFDGAIHLQGYNAAAGDYGYTIVTRHEFDGVELFALHGHLSKASLDLHRAGERFHTGELIAFLGEKHENGGWNPHLHFQLSYQKPEKPDMPGVVSEDDRESALKIYADPRLVLGPLY